MANTILSANMALPVPVPGTETSPQWAIDLNACLSILDAHTHASGSGVQITPDGLNISSDLSIKGNNLTTIRSVRLSSQSASLALATDLNCLFAVSNDLYYNDGLGNHVRLTQSGAVAGTPGSIANLVSPASAAYVGASSSFVFQSAANTPGHIDGASHIFRNVSSGSYGITMSPPSLAANYTITLPALPGATNIMTMDTSGTIAVALNVDNSSLQISANVLSIKAQGVTASMILNATITGTQVSSNINLPGTTVQAGSLNVVTSSTNASTGLKIIRGIVDGTGTITAGEGFTTTYVSVGVMTINFTSAFASAPIIVGCGDGFAAVFSTANVAVGSFTANRNNPTSGALGDFGFNFIAIGPR